MAGIGYLLEWLQTMATVEQCTHNPICMAPLRALLVDASGQGALILNANGVFTYMPTASLWISDTFTYRAQDQSQASNLTHVTFFPGAGRLFLPVVIH